MNLEGVRYFRDRFNVPVADDQVEKLPLLLLKKIQMNINICMNVVRH